jgi:hypothetical protein
MERKMNIVTMLDSYAEIKSQADLLRLDKETRRAAVLASVQAELDALDAEYDPALETASGKLAALESEIKQATAEHGETVKGVYFMAVYSKPRVSWNTKALDGYAAGHPEILQFREEGKPSVSIRAKGA